jgi:signal peptidase I
MRRHLGAAGVVAGALALGRMVRYEIRESSMEPALHPGDWVVGPGPNPGSPGSLKPTELWVLGDNPAAGSVDSRTLGSLDLKLVTARIVARYRPWPPRRIDSIAIR